MSKYWDMKNFILNHVDPVIQTELLKNRNLGDITDEQIKINFNDTSSKLPNSNENIDFSKIIEKDIGFKSKKILLQ